MVIFMRISVCSTFLAVSVSVLTLLSITSCKEKKQSQQAQAPLVGVIKAEKKDVPFQIEVPAKIPHF